MKIHDCEQGTPDWFRLRQGIPTASCFDQIMTPKTMKLSESRHKYAVRLIAERILNWQAQSLETLEHIRNGKEREPQAIRQLEFVHEIETRTIGFITTDSGRWGASPDRLIKGSGEPVEVKCPSDPTHLGYLLLPHPDPYKCQVQGQILTVEADTSLFYSYHPMMPECLLRTDRDQPFIDKLEACLRQFCDEVDEMERRARMLGTFQAYAEMRTPIEVERGQNLRTAPVATDAEMEELINGPTSLTYDWGA